MGMMILTFSRRIWTIGEGKCREIDEGLSSRTYKFSLTLHMGIECVKSWEMRS